MKITITSIIVVAIVNFGGSVFAQSSFPKVAKYVVPIYPPAAQAVRAYGVVYVVVEVDDKGSVLSVAAEDSGHSLLRRAAENAAKQWSFTPVSGLHYITLIFDFRVGSIGRKDKVTLRGDYALEFTTGLRRILDSPSYQKPKVLRKR